VSAIGSRRAGVRFVIGIHISALLLIESRRGTSDGLEASAGYHLFALYVSE
jgi:hypothetical protein